ncbi:hypothetical protein [Endozoicomonas sp. 8E]|uniref:hypothetical protein n=1 Tax=Endozoicomonas sp. 8E TaxID=3035692 RepID=UPI002938D246|nr:hypothetical protein [Endozoicomonas sp. 8E]WOG27184.1 hypothetical protein P6910_21950 [Endozoicomonas sp. 8E]
MSSNIETSIRTYFTVSSIASALFTKTQQRLLAVLYGKPGCSPVSGRVISSITRQTRIIPGELKAITRKTFGVRGVSKEALTCVLNQCDMIFIDGSSV